jgi:hypothetical protein
MVRGRLVLFACAWVCACSSAQDPPSGSTSSPSAPPTFEGDVLPIFRFSCAFSSCHGDPSGHPRVFLGAQDGSGSATTVLANIARKPSVELPSMPYVTPGDPANSYLLHKIDGDQATLDAHCTPNTDLGTKQGCGVSMPQGLPLLDAAKRDVVRAWIAGGTD